METYIYSVKEKWAGEGMPVSEPATLEDISVFSSKNNVVLPQDLIAYFTQLNGTSDSFDNGFFTFYSLLQFKTIKEELGDYGGIPDYRNLVNLLPDHEHCFVFADHSLHLICYAIRLYDRPSENNEVYALCGEVFGVIANSFTEFMNLYLRDDQNIYM